MQVGVVGKPNVGKSTFFSACTMAPAEIADYPFTTIKPNRGMGYVRVPCPHALLGLPACKPKNSPCLDGMRYVPIELIDVAGLVPGAHAGKGLGNQFLDDLRPASALLHIVDASGGTNEEGNNVPVGSHDPAQDVAWLHDEIVSWVEGIIKRDWEQVLRTISAKGSIKPEAVLGERLTGLGIKPTQVKAAIDKCGIDPRKLAAHVVHATKPVQIVANKMDKAPPALVQKLTAMGAVPAAAEAELALRRAKEAGVINYKPGDADFGIVEPSKLNDRQRKALEYIRHHVLEPQKGTGVQQALEHAVFQLLGLICVFPVEDEHHYSSKAGDVLPDAHLIPKGSTAKDLAYKVHTELGDHFIRAVDAKRKRTIGADHALEHGDVVRVVSSK
ncbi:MAG: redox-regulated ATPase YchF [Halobacteriales archaeon]|nr:redox-regulated ATPase YchF [Halobacteriales archaeon]